jgi:hypothetical protein
MLIQNFEVLVPGIALTIELNGIKNPSSGIGGMN